MSYCQSFLPIIFNFIVFSGFLYALVFFYLFSTKVVVSIKTTLMIIGTKGVCGKDFFVSTYFSFHFSMG